MGSNAIKVEDNTAQAVSPSEEALEASEQIINSLTFLVATPEVAMESLLLAFTELAVHQHGNMELIKQQAREAFELMFSYSVQAHADCIGEMGGEPTTSH